MCLQAHVATPAVRCKGVGHCVDAPQLAVCKVDLWIFQKRQNKHWPRFLKFWDFEVAWRLASSFETSGSKFQKPWCFVLPSVHSLYDCDSLATVLSTLYRDSGQTASLRNVCVPFSTCMGFRFPSQCKRRDARVTAKSLHQSSSSLQLLGCQYAAH